PPQDMVWGHPPHGFGLSPGADAQAGQGFQLQQPQKISVMAGETLTLSCNVTGGGPIGAVKWLKGWGSGSETVYDQKDPSSRGMRAVDGSNTDFTILIRDVRPEDAGTYYCVKFHKTTAGEEMYRQGNGTEVLVQGEWGSQYSSQQEPALPGQSPSRALGSALGQGLRSRPRERVPGPGGHSPADGPALLPQPNPPTPLCPGPVTEWRQGIWHPSPASLGGSSPVTSA
uniref:Ig-like domain-containing protein n=1 Tax=Anas zonorhyncha TaxID=75864 RepID=A0A8B9V1C5_9AVES